MTEQQTYQALADILKSGSFTSAIAFVNQYDLSPSSIRIALKNWKKKAKPNQKASFWQSEVPLHFLSIILESELKTDFLMSYFEKDAHSSEVLNGKLLREYPETFIRFAKLAAIYRHPTFLESLDRLTRQPALMVHASFLQELERCREVEAKLNQEEVQDNGLLCQFELDEILFVWTLHHAAFLQEDEVEENKSLQTRIEMATVEEMNRVIHLFHQRKKKRNHFDSQEALQKAWKYQVAEHKKLGRQTPFQVINPSHQLLFDLLHRGIDRQADRNLLGIYLSEYGDFTDPIQLNDLLTNENMAVFRLNDRKSQVEEMYFMDAMAMLEATKGMFQKGGNAIYELRIASVEKKIYEQMAFFGFPEELLLTDGTQLSLRRIILLLQTFAVFNGPPERLFLNQSAHFTTNQADEQFATLFGANQNISQYQYEELYQGIATYFTWPEEEARRILDFLITEVGGSGKPQYWLDRPFLKIRDKVYWIGRMMKDRHWANALRNRFRTDPLLLKKEQREIFEKLEKRAAKILQTETILTGSGIKFEASNGENGDIDVFAYQEGVLLIAEAKSRALSNDFQHAAQTEITRLEGKAAEQLDKILRYLELDWEAAKAKLGIETAKSFEEITIIPLVLTNTYEGDLKLYKNQYHKTTLLELEIIAKNGKEELYDSLGIGMALPMVALGNRRSGEFRAPKEVEWDLWKGKKTFHLEAVQHCLANNLIWDYYVDQIVLRPEPGTFKIDQRIK